MKVDTSARMHPIWKVSTALVFVAIHQKIAFNQMFLQILQNT